MLEDVAIVNARVACALIRCAGMEAENKQREILGNSMAYTEDAFVNIIAEEGIGWNEVCRTLYHDR
jgi:hypothetical protein